MSSHIIAPKPSWREKLQKISPHVKGSLIGASVSLVLAFGGCAIHRSKYVKENADLMKENAGLKKEIIQKTERIRELDNELLPFRNLSVQELRSSDTASLKKLAELMGTFKKDYLEAQEKLKSQQEDIERLMEANKEFEGSFSKVNRRITSEQKKNLIALFTQLPKTRIIVTCHSMAPEARNFSNEIIDIFEKSGFDTEIIFRNILLLGRTGQFIAIKDKENYPSCAGIIQNAFTEIGLVFQGQLDNETSINSIAFNIYDKAP